jgi:putative ATP-dependent endonuclease of OLD family
VDFGYRLNIIPAEAFFASVVFLVEGPSEELFYKALAEKIGIDLDQLNISILIVDGVGFEPYVSLLHSLKIPYVIRTDNDVFKVPHADEYRLAGVQRGIRIYRDYFDVEEDLESILRDHEASLQGFSDPQPPDVNLESAQLVIDALKSIGIFLANADLETDLENSEIGVVLADFVDKREREEVIAAMQKRKATFMFEFLRQHSDSLEALTDDALAEPLLLCQDIANSLYNA